MYPHRIGGNGLRSQLPAWAQYHSLAPMYYRGAAAAVVVYSITDAVSCRCWRGMRAAALPLTLSSV